MWDRWRLELCNCLFSWGSDRASSVDGVAGVVVAARDLPQILVSIETIPLDSIVLAASREGSESCHAGLKVAWALLDDHQG